MAQFFIHRPVLAWVLAIVTMIAGVAGITTLSVSQYPEVAPPTIRISATYRGASAQAVQNSVTTVIEDAMTGLEGLLYMTSTSREGSASMQMIFDQSIDVDQAQIDVQNKLSGVESQLPDSVVDQGVRVSRASTSILMIGALVSPDGTFSTIELGNILEQRVSGPVQRTEGVGSINIFGSGYAMRIWLDPFQLEKYALVPADIISAVQAENTTVTVGQLGASPGARGQQLTASITAQTQLKTVDQFRNILLKTDANGAQVRLGEVARVELGQETYGGDARFNGLNAAGFGVNLAANANAVDTADAVRATLAQLQTALPEGVQIEYAYDTSPFVRLSIEKVIHTLIEAIALVFLVILVFLQNWRATLIPVLAIPVVLLGTFGILAVAGFSINTLTMFAVVLAIGLLVDDAIVVVENVERVMEEEDLDPVEATSKSMRQITGALIGIAAVLSAVFLPMAFMSGSTGVIYRQFSVTIISAMVLSAVVALVLTPALCATMLKRRKGHGIAPARWFNTGFERLTGGYLGLNRRILRWPVLAIGALALVGVLAADLFARLPGSFLPSEDRGVMMTIVRLREGTPITQTAQVVKEIEDYLLTEEKDTVASTFSSLGFGFSGNGTNAATIFVKLRDFDERKSRDRSVQALIDRADARFGAMRLGTVRFVQPPAIQGMGSTAGFSMYLLDQAGRGGAALREAAQALSDLGEGDSRVTALRGGDDTTNSALKLNVDTEKAKSYGLALADVNAMLSVIFSGRDLGDFEHETELRPVIVQGDAQYRSQPSDIDNWSARNSDGEMVPFSAFTSRSWEPAPSTLARFGGTDAVEIQGAPATGVSTGTAMQAMEEMAESLGNGWGVAWTGISYQERLSGQQAPLLYAMSALVVFLCLAGLYESWSVPFAVMLSVPIGVLGALALALWAGQQNDVYFKVGLLTTIGLAARNAILIVEFAIHLEKQGLGLIEATLQAARQRLRPILMTSFAFILGVLPLALATGAGAGAQNAIGIGVLGGMLASTTLGIFAVPALYVCVRMMVRKARAH